MKNRHLRFAAVVFLVAVALITAFSQGGEKESQVVREGKSSFPDENDMRG